MIRHDSKRSVVVQCAGLQPGGSAGPSSGPADLAHLSRVRRMRASAKALDPQLVQRQALCHQSVVGEYAAELLQHMQQLESEPRGERTSAQSFAAQPQINGRMRYLIYDFLMCCHTRLGLSTATLFLSYGILDRYTSRFIVRSGEYQLLALTALWVSSKYWDTKNRAATLPVLLSLCCEQYSAQQFKQTELQLLKYMNWSLCQVVTPDSIVDISLFLAGSDVDVNEVKLGAVMLCELAAFDLQLTLDTEWSKIVLAAITLVKSAIKSARGKAQFTDYETALRGTQLAPLCHRLLQLAIKRDAMPSSFRFKYLRADPPTLSGRILDCLASYHMQWQLEQFLTISPRSDTPDVLSDRSLQHFAFNNSNPSLASCESASPASMASAGSPFASPSLGPELSALNTTTHTTPESVPAPSFAERAQLAAALPPLTPITPSIVQSKIKWGVLRRRPGVPSHSRTSSAVSRTAMGPSAGISAHRKRASSDMDLDFFDDHLAAKR